MNWGCLRYQKEANETEQTGQVGDEAERYKIESWS